MFFVILLRHIVLLRTGCAIYMLVISIESSCASLVCRVTQVSRVLGSLYGFVIYIYGDNLPTVEMVR